MPVLVSLLRGVNVGGRNLIPMDGLRELYESIGLREPRTYVQSGNVVFATAGRASGQLAGRIEQAIERRFGFRPSVIVRTAGELKAIVEANPFAGRRDIHPSRLLVLFLASEPSAAARDEVGRIECAPDEVRMHSREVYIYYPNGMGKPKLSWLTVEKLLKTPGTGRNWNTVTKLLEMAEKLEAA